MYIFQVLIRYKLDILLSINMLLMLNKFYQKIHRQQDTYHHFQYYQLFLNLIQSIHLILYFYFIFNFKFLYSFLKHILQTLYLKMHTVKVISYISLN